MGGLGPALVQDIQCESNGCTLEVLKERLRPRDVVETTPGGDEYVVSEATAPNIPYNVSNPDVVSKCGLSELPSSIHSKTKPIMTPSLSKPVWRKLNTPTLLRLRTRRSP